MIQSKQIIVNNNIYTVDEEVDNVVIEDNLTTKEKIIAKIRLKYSIDDEIAILRQRDTKVDEFNEYNTYIENIKNELKSKN